MLDKVELKRQKKMPTETPSIETGGRQVDTPVTDGVMGQVDSYLHQSSQFKIFYSVLLFALVFQTEEQVTPAVYNEKSK